MIATTMLQAQPAHLRAEIVRALRSRSVAMALLARFEFASGHVRVSDWSVEVTDGRDGEAWVPLPARVGWRDVTGSADGLAPLRIYSLTVPRELARRFGVEQGVFPPLEDKSEYFDRPCSLALQLMRLGAGPNGAAAPLGYPNLLHSGVMDRRVVKVSRDGIVHELHVEGVLARRRVPGNGRLTPRDQKARHPGDLGLDHVTEIPVRVARWPNY